MSTAPTNVSEYDVIAKGVQDNGSSKVVPRFRAGQLLDRKPGDVGDIGRNQRQDTG